MKTRKLSYRERVRGVSFYQARTTRCGVLGRNSMNYDLHSLSTTNIQSSRNLIQHLVHFFDCKKSTVCKMIPNAQSCPVKEVLSSNFYHKHFITRRHIICHLCKISNDQSRVFLYIYNYEMGFQLSTTFFHASSVLCWLTLRKIRGYIERLISISLSSCRTTR